MAPPQRRNENINDKRDSLCITFLVAIVCAGFVTYTVASLLKVRKYTGDYPIFTLQKAAVHNLNLTAITGADSSFLLDTSINITLLYQNPNGHVAISYDRLAVNTLYLGEPVTVPIILPPSVQPPKNANSLSAFLNGHSAPVGGAGLEKMPLIPINITVEGWVTWDSSYLSKEGKLHVICPCYLRSGYAGDYNLRQSCTVDLDQHALKTT
ncbi:unnamed protein product [Cuscuta epithymum]|uniref:Late embryogenesis abundant protein LEA-2 subgroup domain-containing protein n=1 Tax=Cuscuta epithymum TaxID=186058 RepID=A0AAV0EYW8_9ASTE|nr:unnamed protein product [Cuscuta epithymum]